MLLNFLIHENVSASGEKKPDKEREKHENNN